MDVRCSKCGEPWDTDTLHDEVQVRRDLGDRSATYKTVWAEFRKQGCVALSESMGMKDCFNEAAPDLKIAAIYAIMGDDVDGAAATIEDFE